MWPFERPDVRSLFIGQIGSFLVKVNEIEDTPPSPNLVTLSGSFLMPYKAYITNKMKPTEQKIKSGHSGYSQAKVVNPSRQPEAKVAS